MAKSNKDEERTYWGSPNEPDWYSHRPGQSSEAENKPDNTENESAQPASQTPTAQDLAAAESGGTTNAQDAGAEQEKSLLPSTDRLGEGFKHENENTGKAVAFVERLRGSITKRRALAGGGVGGLVGIVIFFIIFGGSFEMIHLRENMLGQANRYVNAALEQRRQTNFYNIVKKLNKGELAGKLDNVKVADKLRARGFIVEFDNGKLNRFGYETDVDGQKRTKFLDLEARNSKQALNAFFDNGEFGKKASRDLDIAIGGRAATWKGKAARQLYGRMNLRFSNWLDRKPSDKAETDRQKFADNLRHADDLDKGLTQRTQGADPRDVNEDGKVSADEKKNKLLGSAAEEFDKVAEEKARYEDPKYDGGIRDDTTNIIRESGGSLDEAAKDPRIVSGAAGGALLKSFSVLGPYQTACSVKGTLQYVANVQNVLLAYQLAKFSMRFMSAADYQKAGALSSDGLKLMMSYLNTRNPYNGNSALQSGGVRNTIFGDKSARPSTVNLGKYSTGRSTQGVLAQASSVADNTMSKLGGAGGCKVANNGFVQVGALAVGITLAVFTGGGSPGATFVGNMAVAVAGQVALVIGQAMLIQAAVGMVVNGYEWGDEAGDALASGWGVMRGMNANANGLRPATKTQIASLNKDVFFSEKLAHEQQSLFKRYLDTENGDSALVKIGSALPAQAQVTHITTGLLTGLARLPGFIAGAVPRNEVFAATEECQDPQVKTLNLQTDVFCNLEFAETPDLDIKQVEDALRAANAIDAEGNPVAGSEYEKYIGYCLVGRPGILYEPDVNETGGKTTAAKYNSCVAGDATYDRYTAWYGYKVDEANFIEEMNGDFGDTEQVTPQDPPVNPGASGGWVWPIKDASVIQDGPCWKGPRLHAGMDINIANSKTIVYAAQNGTVVRADRNTRSNQHGGPPQGNFVLVKVSDNLYYSYQHLQPDLRVSVGQQVVAGVTEIGLAGISGNNSVELPRAHLHFGLSKSANYGSYGNISSTLDPLNYLPKPAPGSYKCTNT